MCDRIGSKHLAHLQCMLKHAQEKSKHEDVGQAGANFMRDAWAYMQTVEVFPVAKCCKCGRCCPSFPSEQEANG
eukprot:8795388-Lingulodinium_polyedra.AAC.1